MRPLHSEKSATLKLMQLCPFPMQLAWHENRTSFFSCRKERGKIHLRLHRLFLGAPTPVLEAVMKVVLKGDRRSGRIVRQMAHFYFSEHRAPPDALKEKGTVYDLVKIRDQIQKDYFPLQDTVPIGWSKRGGTGSFRCMTFGSYDQHRHQIRIHPCLDDAEVPLYFIAFIVYHEMLHAVYPPKHF